MIAGSAGRAFPPTKREKAPALAEARNRGEWPQGGGIQEAILNGGALLETWASASRSWMMPVIA
jgi:hypothetical protein